MRPSNYGQDDDENSPCIWQPKNGNAIYATPSIDRNGTVYIGTGEGWLYAIVNSSNKTSSNIK